MRDRLLRLTSLANPRVRHALRLRESSRYRRQENETIVDGLREVLRASAAGVQPTTLFLTPNLIDRLQTVGEEDPISSLREMLKSPAWAEVTVLAEPPVFEKLAFGHRDEGVVATIRTPPAQLSALPQTLTGPVIVLDRVEKPGNVGAIFRTADATGAAAVLLCDPQTDAFNPAAIRASLGTIFSVPLACGPCSEIMEWLVASKRNLFVLRPDAAAPPWNVNLRQPAAFIFGSEAFGLSAAWKLESLIPLGLPMCGLADSLNVSATTAAILYESLRQRTATPSDSS
jgi:RNA methyltransferase, TrmH family